MYSIHENRHFMYDSYTIHPVGSIDLRRGCLFLFFTFMSRSSFAHFHFSLLIHFPYFLSIDLFIHMSRRLLTTSANAHKCTRHIFCFPIQQTFKYCQQNANANAEKDAQYTFHMQNPVQAEVRTGLSTRHMPYHRDHAK